LVPDWTWLINNFGKGEEEVEAEEEPEPEMTSKKVAFNNVGDDDDRAAVDIDVQPILAQQVPTLQNFLRPL